MRFKTSHRMRCNMSYKSSCEMSRKTSHKTSYKGRYLPVVNVIYRDIKEVQKLVI